MLRLEDKIKDCPLKNTMEESNEKKLLQNILLYFNPISGISSFGICLLSVSG